VAKAAAAVTVALSSVTESDMTSALSASPWRRRRSAGIAVIWLPSAAASGRTMAAMAFARRENRHGVGIGAGMCGKGFRSVMFFADWHMSAAAAWRTTEGRKYILFGGFCCHTVSSSLFPGSWEKTYNRSGEQRWIIIMILGRHLQAAEAAIPIWKTSTRQAAFPLFAARAFGDANCCVR